VSPDDLVLTPRGLRFRGQIIPCSIGRGGISSSKYEGDGATPRGHHRITGCLYRPDRIVQPCPWAEPIHAGDIWSDDPTDPAYNQLTRAPSHFSHEALRRADPLYDLILLTDWNWPLATPGKGSAIFMHQWRKPGHPTEGCIALRRADLHKIAAVALPGTKLIVF